MSDSRPTLFVIGDSISVQYGPYLEQYVGNHFLYARKDGTEEFLEDDDPRDTNGGDSSRVRWYLERMAAAGNRAIHPARRGAASAAACAAGHPQIDVLLVNCGLHDIKTSCETGDIQVPIEEYRTNLTRTFEIGASVAKKLIWVRTTPAVDSIHNKPGMEFFRHASDLKQYNEVADELVAKAKVPSIDLHGFTLRLGAAEEIFCDHVHFVEPVRKLHGAYIAGYVTGRFC